MKILLCFLILFTIGVLPAFAQKGTFVNEVQFIQYLDESTAIEEVKKKNLDIYYSRIPAELIQDTDTKNLQIFYTTGGSFSILTNPAKGNEFNPFYYQKVRFALNYLIDRKLIVDELMSGYGVPMTSNYGPFDPDFLNIVPELEKFHFRYNPELANSMITQALIEAGAKKVQDKWTYNDKPVTVRFFIRNDDPVRNSIGEVISSELEKIGFTVKKDFGDLNKAYVLVYGSDPADLKWSLYTEGYAGRSAFVKYDSLGLAQMYAPWYSNMPGFNNPQYWNYKNDRLDNITKKIYSSNYTSYEERADLIRQATTEGVNESVRIFLAAKIDPFVANKNVNGIINDFGGGIQNRFTPINSRTNDTVLKIGVKQIYQGAWNPVAGLADAYSKNIWDVLYDPGIFKNPYSGQNFAVRQNWKVQTAGPDKKLDVPENAINWSPAQQKWIQMGQGKKATSKITYDLSWSNWHNGQKMDMNDILYSIYFTQEWGSDQTKDDKTFDPEYTPTASQAAKTLVAIRPLDDHRIEVYVNYWHFDESEIADWGGVWVTMPWEVMAAMEKAVIDGKASFSRTNAQAKNLNWLSLIIPRDAHLVGQYLQQFSDSGFVHPALAGPDNADYYKSRYQSSIQWIKQKNHAVISNGPFYLESYSPEARTITIKAFDDPTYPYSAGYWSKFEQVSLPQIISINVPDKVIRGAPLDIPIQTKFATKLYYFVNDASGAQISNGIIPTDDAVTISLDSQTTRAMSLGGNDIKIYAVSDSVFKPDIYTTSFSAVDSIDDNYTQTIMQNKTKAQADYGVISMIAGAVIIGIILYIRRSRKQH